MKKRIRILKTASFHSQKELDFELDYQLSLSTRERFEMMFRKSRETIRLLLKNGHLKPFEIIKRT